jgi:hypothetical protein
MLLIEAGQARFSPYTGSRACNNLPAFWHHDSRDICVETVFEEALVIADYPGCKR